MDKYNKTHKGILTNLFVVLLLILILHIGELWGCINKRGGAVLILLITQNKPIPSLRQGEVQPQSPFLRNLGVCFYNT